MSMEDATFVHTVTIAEDLRGSYVFADFDDAQAFKASCEKQNINAIYDEQIIIDRDMAQGFITDPPEFGDEPPEYHDDEPHDPMDWVLGDVFHHEDGSTR